MHNRTMHVDDVVVSGNSGWSVIAELASYHQGNLEIVGKMTVAGVNAGTALLKLAPRKLIAIDNLASLQHLFVTSI
jgi:hypothetical protein